MNMDHYRQIWKYSTKFVLQKIHIIFIATTQARCLYNILLYFSSGRKKSVYICEHFYYFIYQFYQLCLLTLIIQICTWNAVYF